MRTLHDRSPGDAPRSRVQRRLLAVAVLAGVAVLVPQVPALLVPQDSELAAFEAQAQAQPGCRTVEQHGITFSFGEEHACGTFANGDPWVVAGPEGVDVVSVSPAAKPGSGRHGLMVNPSGEDQGYDSRVGRYDAALDVQLPYRAVAGDSLIKSVSEQRACSRSAQHRPCLATALVLTVLDAVPADAGRTVFRPPYFGTHKPLLSTQSLRTDLLPSLPAVQGAPDLGAVRDRFARVQLDHISSWQGRYLHPTENFRSLGDGEISNYGSDLARDNNDAVLRLMLDDPVADKMPALVNVVQAGIDWYGAVRGGVRYGADGGHFVGRKVMVTFAGILLDDADIKQVAGRDDYSENAHVYFSPTAGRPLFGKPCPEGMYDDVLTGGSGSRDCRDPNGEIDGGEKPGSVYQNCCTASAYKASSLAVRLLPGGRAVWAHDPFHDYVDRWVDHGAWTVPDSRGRFEQLHGTNADDGNYRSRFQSEMWLAQAAATTFSDIEGNVHQSSIEDITRKGIVRGYADGTYRPDVAVSRGQLAAFLDRALALPAAPPAGFSDTAGSTHEEAIDRVAARGITTGYTDGSFRPDRLVTRAQMAAFLQRAFELPGARRDHFVDTAGDVHADAIDAVAEAGIAQGFGDQTYRPTLDVTRGQIATFLDRALEYAL